MLFSPFIESFFSNISSSLVTESFTWLLLAVFILAFFLGLIGKARSFTSYAPTLMTSLGILGTFVGIVIGLMHFDTTDIDASIPILLGGLKTAFITSVCGLFGAVTFTFFNTTFFLNRKTSKEERAIEQAVTPEMIYLSLEQQKGISEENAVILQHMQKGLTGDEEGSLVGLFKLLRSDMNDFFDRSHKSGEQVQKSMELSADRLAQIHQSLSGEEEGSLVGQMKLFRGQLSDVHTVLSDFSQFFKQHSEVFDERLFKELAEFADMMSRAATETIIEALKNVIQDFNKNLTDQFGENFKALDASVKKLVDWQEEYRVQVEQMGEQYQQSVESLVNTRESVAGIWQECQNIPQAMEELRAIIDVNQHQIQELARHLETFVTMRDKAIEAVPTITQQIDKVGENLTESTSNLRDRLLGVSEDLLKGSNDMKVSLQEGAEHFRDSVTITQQSFNELSHTVKDTFDSVSEMLKDTTTTVNEHARNTLETLQEATTEVRDVAMQISQNNQQASEDFKRIANDLNSELSNILKSSQNTFEGVMKEAAESSGNTINNQLRQIEEATARALSGAMQVMTNQLTNVTGRFVDDYETMVKAMERVINSVK